MTTTVNMKLADYNRLSTLSRKFNVSRSKIIAFILAKVTEDSPFLEIYGKGISYQSNCDDWHKFHIIFDEHEAERNIDLKKLYKLSLSFIISLALDYYELLLFKVTQRKAQEKIKKTIDIYRPKYYFLCTESQKGYRSLTFVWEMRE